MGGACLHKECPTLVEFGMLKQTIKFDVNGSEINEHTLICHAGNIIRNRHQNEAYRTHPVECKFNITGNNHVKWVLRGINLASPIYKSISNLHKYVEAVCVRGKNLLPKKYVIIFAILPYFLLNTF